MIPDYDAIAATIVQQGNVSKHSLAIALRKAYHRGQENGFTDADAERFLSKQRGMIMRQVKHLALTEVEKGIDITCDDRDNERGGNMSHEYRLAFTPSAGYSRPTTKDGMDYQEVRFQRGPVAEHGVNGITNEALLAIVIDRLEGAQEGPYKSRYNALAITKIEEAVLWLSRRTLDRQARGVEGTSKV
jgi:hypothetical protein